LDLEAPPLLPEGGGGTGLQSLLPLAGAGSSMTLMLVFRGSPLAAVGALVMVLTVLATVVLVVSQRGQATRNRRQQRERYLDYLEELRERLRTEEDLARAAARALDPPPPALVDVIRDPARLWERRRRDRDFLAPRIGTGALPGRPMQMRDQGSAVQPTDPFMLAEARLLAQRFATVPDLPLRVPLDRTGEVSVVGEREEVLNVARALLVQVAALHAPEDVALAVSRPVARSEDWAFAQWLPHLSGPERAATGPVVRIADDLDGLADLLAGDLEERASLAARSRRTIYDNIAPPMQRLIVFVDADGSVAAPLPLPDQNATAAELGITVVHLIGDRLAEPSEVGARVTVADGRVVVEDLRDEPTRVEGTVDDVPPALADGLARLLSPLRLSADSYEEGDGGQAADALSLLQLPDPAATGEQPPWRERSERDLLRVPLGVDDDGRPVVLDLKEPAQLGMGPHGLCVGATGSGKSELLRTLVLSLIATHPPEQLSMVLVDYKGGATFAPFQGLPHVAGLITNLADDLALVERVHTSLAGEVQRRQQVLKDAGVSDIVDHGLLRATRPELAALPHLLVIVDEFGELLTAEPDFIELFLSIGRIGRSIGVHLLLSSQRIEGGKLKGLDTYLSYRLGLRTFSEAESRTVLDTPDAFALPALPGYGYLKVDTSTYRRFKAAYVSGPVPTDGDTAPPPPPALVVPLPRTGAVPSARPAEGRVARLPDRTSGPTLLTVLVDRLMGSGAPTAPVWLPPLPAAVTLDQVAGPLRPGPDGLRAATDAPLRVPVGVLDDPARQWQGRWDVDLTRAGGHLAVIGGPRSGRSTLLRTLVLSLALASTPRQVAVYAVDLLGGGLQSLAHLPHVGGVASRGDRERVRRTLEEVTVMLETRERVFREHHLDSVEALRVEHAAGGVPELPVADVVLVLDGYAQLSGDFEDVEPLVHALVARGGSYGVHVVVSVGRWGELRVAQQAAFGNKVELRLNDPGDSMLGRKLAATLSAEQPGRALTDTGLVGHVALPRLDGHADQASAGQGLAQAVAAVRSAAAGGLAAPPVRVLPQLLPARELAGPGADPLAVPIGLDEADLSPVSVDLFGEDQHLLVLGDGGSGKTNVLRLLAHGLVARYNSEQLVLAVVDPRRSLADVVPEDHLGGRASGVAQAAGLAGSVAKELEQRAEAAALAGPGAGEPPGLRIVLLVDDFDVLTAAGSNPLAPLLPYLASGRDLGLHVVASRRVAGAARGLFEPFLLAVRESGATGLLLSGDRGEGQLLGGVRARALPPGRGLLVRPGGAVRTVQTAWSGE